MPGAHTFYDGSTVLEPFANLLGIDTDRVNFVVCMFTSLTIAYLYRKFLPADAVPRQVRLVIPPIIGLAFLFFSFGRAIKHLLANCLVSYAIMYFAPPKQVHKCVFMFSMGYLLFIHFYRWIILNSYTLDITGPIMVAVEKVIMMSFNLHDGCVKKRSELSDEQAKESIKEVPSLLEYMSFMFNFQTVLTGPVNNYSDYIKYMEGTHIPRNRNGQVPDPTSAALKKLGTALVLMLIVAIPGQMYKVEDLNTPAYLELSYPVWFFWWWFTLVLVRCGYYFAWGFADAICNMSGFGFSGYDSDGEAKWELCTNVRPQQVEMAQSFKETLDGWNTLTGVWLRKVAYERAPKNIRTVATYVLSAVWHGVSVGYYTTFFTGALFTLAGHTFRRCIRWRFLGNVQKKGVYDAFSFIITKIALAYCTFPFVTMNFEPAFSVYCRVWFIPHIAAFAILFGLQKVFKPQPKPNDTYTKTEKAVDEKKSL